jgi:hypothetical protein
VSARTARIRGNGRQSWCDHRRLGYVVKAGDREVLTDAQASVRLRTDYVVPEIKSI